MEHPGTHPEHDDPPRREPEGASVAQATRAGRDGVPWGVLDAVGVLAVAAVLSVVLVFAAVLLVAGGLAPDVIAPVLMPLPLVALGVVTLVWVHVRYRAAAQLTGPVRARARHWLMGVAWGVGTFFAVTIVLGLVLQALAALAGIQLPRPQEGLREVAADPTLAPWLLFSAVVVAPLAEELFFRGLLYPALRRRMRAAWAIALSAAAFAAAHVLQELDGQAGPVAFVLILPVGLLLGWLYERYRTLAVPIAVHATFNLVVTTLMFAA